MGRAAGEVLDNGWVIVVHADPMNGAASTVADPPRALRMDVHVSRQIIVEVGFNG
jgi:hypothetical protein